MRNYQVMTAIDYSIRKNGRDLVTVYVFKGYRRFPTDKDPGITERISVNEIRKEVRELERTLSQEDARLLAGRSFIEQMGRVREQKYSGARRN